MFLVPKSFILSIAGVSALGVAGSYGVPQFLSSDESLNVGGLSSISGDGKGKAAYDCFNSNSENSLEKCIFNAIKKDKKTA